MRGTLTTAFSFILGYIAPDVAPGSITPALQNTAFIITILVGLFTLVKGYFYLRDRYKNSGHGKEEDI